MPLSHKEKLSTVNIRTVLRRLVAELRQELQPQNVLSVLSAGLLNGIITVIVCIAFANLIFAGNLPRYLPTGINLILVSSMVIAIVSALTSSLPGVVASVQDSPVAILAVVATSIVHTMRPTATPTEIFFTVVAAMGMFTVLTGVFFFLLGYFELGDLIRFIPYPVIGGFLGGTGLLLVLGAFSMMVKSFNGVADFAHLFMGTAWLEWLPGTIFAVLLFVALNRFQHPLVLPGMVLFAAVVFYFLPRLLPWPLPVPVPSGDVAGAATASTGTKLANLLLLSNLRHVNWPILLPQVLNGASMAVVSVIALLLNASGLELGIQQDIDLNRELRAVGVSNVLAGLGGGAPGYHALSLTVLAYRMRAKSRLVGFVIAAVCGLVLLTGEAWLRFLPNPVLGGLVLFLGFDFLVTWVYKTWFTLPRVEYAILISILLIITLVGFLEGIGVGLVLTVILFVVDYSRINVVRHSLSGATYQSNFQYPRLYQHLLKRKGHQICIFELQGFIFFGTAHKLLAQVRQRLTQDQSAKPHFVVLDFRLVSGLDTSAVFSFVRMKQLALKHKLVLVFVHLSPKVQRQLETDVFQPDEHQVWRIFPDLDRGVEWCEAQLLETLEQVGFNLRDSHSNQSSWYDTLPTDDKFDKLLALLESEDDESSDEDFIASRRSFDAAYLKSYVRPSEVADGDFLIRQGEDTQALYFIDSGQVTVQFEQSDGQTLRLSTMGAGTVVGELSFYLDIPASASVMVTQPGQVYALSSAKLKEIEATDPRFNAALHEFIARLLSERLLHADTTLRALLK